MRYLLGAMAYLSGLYACFMAYESHDTGSRLNLLGTASGGVFFLMNCSTFLDVVRITVYSDVLFIAVRKVFPPPSIPFPSVDFCESQGFLSLS